MSQEPFGRAQKLNQKGCRAKTTTFSNAHNLQQNKANNNHLQQGQHFLHPSALLTGPFCRSHRRREVSWSWALSQGTFFFFFPFSSPPPSHHQKHLVLPCTGSGGLAAPPKCNGNGKKKHLAGLSWMQAHFLPRGHGVEPKENAETLSQSFGLCILRLCPCLGHCTWQSLGFEFPPSRLQAFGWSLLAVWPCHCKPQSLKVWPFPLVPAAASGCGSLGLEPGEQVHGWTNLLGKNLSFGRLC